MGVSLTRYFNGDKPVKAVVEKYYAPRASHDDDVPIWHIRHEDGDEEDLEKYELETAMLASGDFVGMGIVRYFDGVPVRGIVTEYLPGEPFDLWHCRHEDGDEEDLEQYEVVQATRDYRISVRGMKLSNTIPSSKDSKLSTLEMKNLLLDHGWYIDAKANSHYSYHTPDGTQTFTSLASAMRRFYQDGGVAAEEVSMIEQDRDEMEIEEKVEEVEEKVEEKEVEEKTPDDVQTEQKEEEKVDPWVSFEQSFLEEEVEEEKKTNDDTVVEGECEGCHDE